MSVCFWKLIQTWMFQPIPIFLQHINSIYSENVRRRIGIHLMSSSSDSVLSGIFLFFSRNRLLSFLSCNESVLRHLGIFLMSGSSDSLLAEIFITLSRNLLLSWVSCRHCFSCVVSSLFTSYLVFLFLYNAMAQNIKNAADKNVVTPTSPRSGKKCKKGFVTKMHFFSL